MHVHWCVEANPAQGNACIIHGGVEGLAGTQCCVRGQTAGSFRPMAAGMALPNEARRRA